MARPFGSKNKRTVEREQKLQGALDALKKAGVSVWEGGDPVDDSLADEMYATVREALIAIAAERRTAGDERTAALIDDALARAPR